MGEAWFMGEERQTFTELLGDLDQISTFDLQRPLEEIASGFSCFGPEQEWIDWYHYLLGALLPRAHEQFVDSLLEFLITGFIGAHPACAAYDGYGEFRGDALLTLGRCMMQPDCWNGSNIAVGKILHRSNNNPNKVWLWWEASGDLSSSLFFCLKYLPEQAVEPWLRSVFEIPSPHWRAQLIVWAVYASDILDGELNWPSQLTGSSCSPIAWAWSHMLGPDMETLKLSASPTARFIPEHSRQAAAKLLHSYFTDDVYLDWLSSISAVPYLEGELGAIPSTFEDLYVRE